jgi:hypothetical protein
MPSWKKVITSGSDAALNSINVTNGLTLTGSLNHFGDYNHTGSVYHSGSKFLTGIFSQTGSMFITGSTTQIGNNTLLGTTTLSGSITISGSTTVPATPTIKIYGDMETNGVIKFMPVSKNIDTSISASYIYVSGSTNDLYFSQNSAGYNNVTRLRWLEGNLYTGLLHGGLITTQSSTVYQISSGSGIIVNLNASLAVDPYPIVQFLQWGNLSASIAPFTASYQQAFVGIDSTGNIFAQGTPFSNGQFDSVINIGGVFFQNQSTINGVKTQPSVAYGFEQQQNTFNRAFGPLKLSGYTLAVSASSTGSLIVASGTAYAPGSNYIVDPNEPYYAVDNGTNVSKIFRYRQSGSSWVYDTNAGAGYTTIDPTQYSNNGVLTAVPGGGSNRQWSIQRVFWFPNSVIKAIVVYYGNATYATELDAIANISFESFVEAPNTSANAIYLGAIVVRNNANFTVTDSYKIQPGGLFRQVGGSGGGGSVITQTLSGLSDVLISGPTNGQPLVYNNTSAKWQNSSTLTADLTGNASTATSASYATTASYVLQSVSSSFATTASYVNTLNQNVLITGTAAIGTSSLGPNENTLTLGARDAANEGGQLGLNAPGGTYTSASFLDVWSNQVRILRGTNAGSDGLVTQWNLHTKQMQLPAYTAASSFPGTAAANLAVDSGGNVITVSTTGGTVFPYVGNAVITGSLTTTGIIYAQPNGGMYFQGGDDAALYDINVANTMGIYGMQDSTIGSIKLGSGGGIISGKGGNIGIGTTNPTNGTLEVNGNVYATSFTGSLLGTASYATQALSASYAPAGNPFPYNGNAQISGSLGVTGSFAVQTYDGVFANAFIPAIQISDATRNIYDVFGTSSIVAAARVLVDSADLPSLGWAVRTLYDTSPETSIDWGNRIAYDATGTTYSIDWNNRLLVDPATLSSIDWSSRELLDSAGDAAITWNYLTQAQAVEINSYTRKTLDLGTVVENFSNLPVYASFNPDGEILKGVALDASVVDFDLVFLEKATGKWYPVDQTTSSSSKLLGIAWGVGTGKEKVFLEGTMVVAPASTGASDVPLVDDLDLGSPIYINTSGTFYMSTAAPGTSGDYVRILGHAYYQGVTASDYWVMKFRPSHDWYVI